MCSRCCSKPLLLRRHFIHLTSPERCTAVTPTVEREQRRLGPSPGASGVCSGHQPPHTPTGQTPLSPSAPGLQRRFFQRPQGRKAKLPGAARRHLTPGEAGEVTAGPLCEISGSSPRRCPAPEDSRRSRCGSPRLTRGWRPLAPRRP